jgi:hypothetical protein
MRVGRGATVAVIAALTFSACSGDGTTSETSTAASVAPSSTTTIADTTTSEPATTSAVPTTETPTTPAPTSAPTTTTAEPPSTACPDGTTIASGATNLVAINGDIDGDTLDDVVTSYSLDGVPHVHATLATGGNSDTEAPIGFADTVSIQFMDFDYALGADVPPPVAVLAIGPTKAGTAVGAFLTLTPKYCIRVWHNNTTDDTLFTFRISAEPIYQGLFCDGAMGHINHSLSTVEPNPDGTWTITLQPFGHNFTTVDLHAPDPPFVQPDSPDIQHNYGDITTCAPALFP